MPDIPPRLAEPNIDGLLASPEAQAAAPPPVPSPAPVPAPSGDPEERRSAQRFEHAALSGDIRLTIPGMSDILLVDISETGVLIETKRPMRPGMSADLVVRFNGKRPMLRATSVRSTLHAITSKSEAVYRTTPQFDRCLPLDVE